uniref:Uncharacterized protein n=1 Tax=Candidatus Kentrum sp. TC TaxID=2126339 RepID=A0A450YTG9_9GAMM|nr:MAG: hypothetical protein BECKTC1821E_GA0114239_10412 [Candidatus Kentron sp. TC]VFK50186.1 MAG: hypothetical protein BECKTC1821D_GA0114238_109314 [Candidatus Kentron sp. TC]
MYTTYRLNADELSPGFPDALKTLFAHKPSRSRYVTPNRPNEMKPRICSTIRPIAPVCWRPRKTWRINGTWSTLKIVCEQHAFDELTSGR